MTLKPNQKPSKEQLKEVEMASKKQISFDEDSPEFTEEQLEQFRRILAYTEGYRKENRKQNVSFYIQPKMFAHTGMNKAGRTISIIAIIESTLPRVFFVVLDKTKRPTISKTMAPVMVKAAHTIPIIAAI
jgi:hypothetical protein